jgi:hypothetical protein
MLQGILQADLGHAANSMTRKYTRKTKRKQKRPNMDMRKYASTVFLKVEHVREKPLRLEIAYVKEGKFDKPDCYFTTGEVLSLNGTNTGILMQEYGIDSDGWGGKESS